MSVRSTKTRGSGGTTRLTISMRPARPVRYGSITDATSSGTSTGAGFAVGEDAKLENSAEIRRSSRTCPRIERDAALDHVPQRLAAVGVHAAEVLGRQLDRRQRVLDLVRDLARHLGPRLEAMGALELRALRLELRGHAVERVDEAPQLVGGLDRDLRVEVAARDPPRRARQAPDGIRDALGHVEAHRRRRAARTRAPRGGRRDRDRRSRDRCRADGWRAGR